MKRKALLLTIITFLLLPGFEIHAQEKVVNLYDSAYTYYKKKDFKKSAYFYDTYYLVQKNRDSNYDTYRAAVASSYTGNMENAKYYIKRSGEIGYDYSGFYDFPSYDKFVHDTIHNHLRDLPEWKNFISVLKYKADSAQKVYNKIIAALEDQTVRSNQAVLSDSVYWKSEAGKGNAADLIQKIKNFRAFPSISKCNFWTMYHIKVNDTLTVPFLVYIPEHYQANQKTPLYVYLHGAVVGRTAFSNPAWIEKGNEVKIMDRAKTQNAIIIYPFGRKDFGWIYQQKAFETILREIEMVKSLYNINDNKVYITGHSNGGSGTYWFAMKQPTYFAAFLGLNYLPKVYSSNTSLRNMRNEKPFYGISGSEDSTFPLPIIQGIYDYGLLNGANWKNFTKKGDHGLAFKKDSINFLFDTLATVTRNPFPKKLEWETDDVKNGRNSWLEIVKLDTLAEKASWQNNLNPTLVQNGKSGEVNFNKNKSGAIIARADGNNISIQTSRVKAFKLYISADMFDLNKPLKITINDKKFLNLKLHQDKKVILDEFLKTKDREFIVSNSLELNIE